jgi:transcription elongation factor Elf1
MLEAKGVDPFECLEKVFTLPWKPRFRQAVITPKEVKLTIDFTCPKCNFSDMYTFDLQREQFNIKRATLECGNCHEKYTR